MQTKIRPNPYDGRSTAELEARITVLNDKRNPTHADYTELDNLSNELSRRDEGGVDGEDFNPFD